MKYRTNAVHLQRFVRSYVLITKVFTTITSLVVVIRGIDLASCFHWSLDLQENDKGHVRTKAYKDGIYRVQGKRIE